MTRTILVVVLGATCLGCGSQTGWGRATPMAPDRARVTLGVDASLLSANLTTEEPVRLPWLQLQGGSHRGIADGVEVGGRAWAFGLPRRFYTAGVAADVKVALARARAAGSGTDIALGGSLGYQRVDLGGQPWHVPSLMVPLLVGHNFGRHQLVYGPRAAVMAVSSYGQNPLLTYWGGASVGFAWRVTQTMDLQPEAVFIYSPVPFNGEGAGEKQRGLSSLSLGLSGAWNI